jgi:hypothetical protein
MTATATRLIDYRPPAWTVRDVALRFELDFAETRVFARLRLERHPARDDGEPLRLHGEDLETVALRLDGRLLGSADYRIDEDGLEITAAPSPCVLESEVLIHPERNTRLEGLYRSGDFLTTQCEAEGFRRITWFIDRPDVMATYHVRLEADRTRFPLLLANGNPGEQGRLAHGRHFAEWTDPWPKPSYLFAIVAGQLEFVEDHFRTMEGRDVRLRIHAEAQAIGRCTHAMQSLKRAMIWDEQEFGRAYDLDVFNIVATYDFNMGAMENKGLNIFNAKAIVADPETATDADLDYVEAVVAHEYFHNWTGNRITCRDWFQLSLKEGLTVFRDQEFSADQGSRAVKRIDDVRQLRSLQFPEDAGPFAHPVRPAAYSEINNFYTATVYDKGAEVVRMYRTLLGERRLPQWHGPVFPAPRWPGSDLRRLPARDGRRQRCRPRRARALVRPGRHAAAACRAAARRGDAARALAPRPVPGADPGPGRQATAADPGADDAVRSRWPAASAASGRRGRGHRVAARAGVARGAGRIRVRRPSQHARWRRCCKTSRRRYAWSSRSTTPNWRSASPTSTTHSIASTLRRCSANASCLRPTATAHSSRALRCRCCWRPWRG